MAINFSNFGSFGVVLFFMIVLIMELFFGVIGIILANFIGINGILWWIVVFGIVIILNAIFVDIR